MKLKGVNIKQQILHRCRGDAQTIVDNFVFLNFMFAICCMSRGIPFFFLMISQGIPVALRSFNLLFSLLFFPLKTEYLKLVRLQLLIRSLYKETPLKLFKILDLFLLNICIACKLQSGDYSMCPWGCLTLASVNLWFEPSNNLCFSHPQTLCNQKH